ncbi:MAG: hypothetical protein AAGA25_17710 [Planctomycetota bacterium]
MLKFAASIITCIALLGLVNPASGLIVPTTGDVLTVESQLDFCKKDGECKGKKKGEVEKPAESQIELCKKDGECKGKKKGEVEKPAESQLELCKKGKKKGELEKPAESQIELCKKDGECKGKKGDKDKGEVAG